MVAPLSQSRAAPGTVEGRRPRRGPSKLGNTLKTAVLLAGLTAIVLALGQRLGGPSGLAVAFVIVLVMNFASYWFSDKIALAIHGARPLDPQDLPWLHEAVRRLAQRARIPM